MISDNSEKPTMGFAAFGPAPSAVRFATESIVDQMAAQREANKAAQRLATDADERARAVAPQLLAALKEIVAQDPVELALDPNWAQRIAAAAVAIAEGGAS